MNTQRQIEEMAVELSEGGCADCRDCSYEDRFNCKLLYDASILYNAGYRKQSVGEWVENDYGQTVCSHCDETAEVDAWELELRDKVRYSKTKYCPNCGARMKGGE